jgi:hypothetical protein
MSPAAPASTATPHIIIHHLSDLHYQHRSRASTGVVTPPKDDLLVKYRGYLERLEPDRRPDLLVITGDLTTTGSAGDLGTVQEILRNDFPSWAGELAEHIIVVPGPRDVNWEGTDPPGLKTFYATFRDFGLPYALHGTPHHAVRARPPLNFVAYPIDTCYSLEECREEMNEQFHLYGSEFQSFVQQYRQAQRSTSGLVRLFRGDPRRGLAALRERYLQLTESNDLTLLDAGRIHQDDLTAFTRWAESFRNNQDAAGAEMEPLKILITHHPLAVEPEAQTAARDTKRTGMLFEKLASAAGNAGFHLALHGHIHKPQVLADLSLLQEANARHPMRQVGAGSLGDGGTFNEITATYSRESDDRHWRLEIRTINLKAPDPHDATRFVLLNRTEDAAKRAEQLEHDRTRRNEFDDRVRAVMRQYSEAVYRAQPASTGDKPAPGHLPQAPLQSVESIIREVVFPGYGLRVRLFLKEQQHTRTIPQLSPVYLAPPYSDGSSGPGPVTYPGSLAALSLVLGKTLIYPGDLAATLGEQDYEWLRRSGKDRELTRVLEARVAETRGTSYPGPEGARQYEALLAKLVEGQGDPLRVEDFYRDATSTGSGQTYPEFICVPYPQRSPAQVVPDMPEVAVLVVSVRAPDKPEGEQDRRVAPAGQQKNTFTPERVGMLETLAELAGMILVSSSALAKPKGVWDARLWAYAP